MWWVWLHGAGWGGGGVGGWFFFFKQKTAYEMCGRDWSSDVCSSDLVRCLAGRDRLGEVCYSHFPADAGEEDGS